MDQRQLAHLVCSRPQNFAWFIGAGASRSAGLPTATDIIWDLKCRYYCEQENQDISRQDVQSEAVRARIQAFLDSRGFPALWAANEYGTYFEKIFGSDLERQRRYLRAILSEDKVTLVVGSRVMAALLASGNCRAVFTTNFDSVLEKAVAEVSGRSLTAFHLEGSRAAWQAVNNEEYPVYCKLHGDFRYEQLKNLPPDIQEQNEELAKAFTIASSRFGFIVAGYSGRDGSIINMFRKALAGTNPFPHGLYWTNLNSSPVHPAAEQLLEEARQKRVDARAVEIETFDSLMLRLWRNISGKPHELDAKVRKSHLTPASIPLADMGNDRPIIRLNALPIVSLPTQCNSISFQSPKDWDEVRAAAQKADNALILTKSDTVWSWGASAAIPKAFGEAPTSVEPCALPADLGLSAQLHVKRFVEDALCAALVRDKPLLKRTARHSAWILIDPHANDLTLASELGKVVGKTSGTITGLVTEVTEEHPEASRVTWAEAIRVSIDMRNRRAWLLIDPDIWIWPVRARDIAAHFMSERRRDRFNKKYNELLDTWIRLILGPAKRASEMIVRPFAEGSDIENPTFRLLNRTGFSWRLQA
jgi:hypothetical protein